MAVVAKTKARASKIVFFIALNPAYELGDPVTEGGGPVLCPELSLL
jgi:hypothetical protein